MPVRRTAPRYMVRRALRWFLLWNAAALAVVVTGVVLLSWVVARNEAVRDAEVTARAVAETIVAPLTADDFHARNPAALTRMGEVMEHRSRDGSISHLKVWADAECGRGTVLWSDEKPLVGRTFELDAEEYAVFGTHDTVAEISHLEKEENQLERSAGELIEVYTGTHDEAGAPLLFEIYISTADLPGKVVKLVGVILPLPIAALITLSLTMWPLSVSLARRVDQGQQQMQRLLVNAVESSDLERRRIAQDLHDGVVQDLAGISYALDSDASKLPRGVGRHHLQEMGDILRRDLASLRTLMTEIYPVDLATEGLAAAVRDLGSQQGLPPGFVRFEIDEPLRPQPLTDRLIYRAVREALVNAVKHAQASSVLVRIEQDAARMTFEVIDDGVGFDPTATSGAGHLGMRLISEMVADAGGLMTIESSAGSGSRVRGELPL